MLLPCFRSHYIWHYKRLFCVFKTTMCYFIFCFKTWQEFNMRKNGRKKRDKQTIKLKVLVECLRLIAIPLDFTNRELRFYIYDMKICMHILNIWYGFFYLIHSHYFERFFFMSFWHIIPQYILIFLNVK